MGRLFPSIKDSEFISLAEITSRSALMATLSDRSCKPRLNISGIEVVHRTPSMFGKADELFEDINKHLENKNILKSGYGACLLYIRNHNGSGCGHASTVVGRRFNKKSSECEYLIRNSWGRGCSSYDSSLDCDQGNVWVPKSVLVKGLRKVSYIK